MSPLPDNTPETPQDADVTQTVSTTSTRHLPAAAWPTWVPASGASQPDSRPDSRPDADAPPVPTSSGPQPTEHPSPVARAPQPHPEPESQPEPPRVTYLPAPTGPNWGLVVVGLVFALVGGGVVANQAAGFQVSSLSELGPSVLVIGGLVLALLGIVGILTRRHRG